MSEKQIENAIIDYIEVIGGVAIPQQSGEGYRTYKTKSGENKTYRIKYAPRGTSDILAMYKGTPLAIEVKKDKKGVDRWLKIIEKYKKGEYDEKWEREVGQYEFAKDVIKAGGTFILAHSIDCVKKELDIPRKIN